MRDRSKIPCIEVKRPDTHGNQWCISRLRGFSVEDEFDGAEDGESIVMTLKLMTEAELDALPDFQGW